MSAVEPNSHGCHCCKQAFVVVKKLQALALLDSWWITLYSKTPPDSFMGRCSTQTQQQHHPFCCCPVAFQVHIDEMPQCMLLHWGCSFDLNIVGRLLLLLLASLRHNNPQLAMLQLGVHLVGVHIVRQLQGRQAEAVEWEDHAAAEHALACLLLEQATESRAEQWTQSEWHVCVPLGGPRFR